MESVYSGRLRGRARMLDAATGMRRLRSQEADQRQVMGMRKSQEVRAGAAHEQGMRLQAEQGERAQEQHEQGKRLQAEQGERAQEQHEVSRDRELAEQGRLEGLPKLAFALETQLDVTQAVKEFNKNGDLQIKAAWRNPDGSATVVMPDGSETVIDARRLGRLAEIGSGAKVAAPVRKKPVEPSKRFGVIEQAMIEAGYNIDGFIEKDENGRQWLSTSGYRARDLADQLAAENEDLTPREIAEEVARRLGLENPRTAEVKTLQKELAEHEAALAGGDKRHGLLNSKSREASVSKIRERLRELGVEPTARKAPSKEPAMNLDEIFNFDESAERKAPIRRARGTQGAKQDASGGPGPDLSKKSAAGREQIIIFH
jgi:hypothetical protein